MITTHTSVKVFLLAALTILMNTKPCIGQSYLQKELKDYIWDLSGIYQSDIHWQEDLKYVNREMSTIHVYKTTMTKSPQHLSRAMDAFYDLRSKAAKLEIYGALRSDVATTDEKASEMASTGLAIEREVEASLAFVVPEIAKIGKGKLQQWMKTEPSLQKHQRRINRIIQEIPYTKNQETEALINIMKGWPQTIADSYFRFFESDHEWPVVTMTDGKKVSVHSGNYRNLRGSSDPKDREQVSKTYLSYLGKYQPILGFLLTKRIEADIAIAKQKKFNDAIDAIWYLRDGIPSGTYKTMIATAHANSDLLSKYANVLAKVYALPQVAYQDFISSSFLKTFTIQESWDIILKALQPLGEDFIAAVKNEMSKPTMHLAPLSNKRSFYSNQMPIAGIPSYSMMTYSGSFASLGSLMGMIAQKVRFSKIPKENCPDTRDDPPVYGNGTLYIAEMMLADYLIENAKTKEEKKFYLKQSITRLWNNCFTQAVSAELESSIHDAIKRNQPPSGRAISDKYYNILKSYYQDIPIDSSFANEWMINSVPFMSFEAQFWVSSMGFACVAYERMKKGDPTAKKIMTESLMGKYETDLSYDMLKHVGIDLTHQSTYQAIYDRMNHLLKQMENL